LYLPNALDLEANEVEVKGLTSLASVTATTGYMGNGDFSPSTYRNWTLRRMITKSSTTHFLSLILCLGDRGERERGVDIARIHRLQNYWAIIEALK
jgi:hypothetical protein